MSVMHDHVYVLVVLNAFPPTAFQCVSIYSLIPSPEVCVRALGREQAIGAFVL